MTVLGWALAALASLAVLTVAGVWAFQRWGIYAFDRVVETPLDAGVATGRVVTFPSEDGTEVTAWLVPPAGDMPVIVSFHGGYTSIGPSAARFLPLVERGYGLAVMQYRGSGADRRHPSELGFAADARAFYDRLDDLFGQRVPPARRVLHGFSLGASVAARLGASRPFAAVILEGSFPQVCTYYTRRFRGVPMCLLMWAETNRIIDFVPKITAPILFLHGEDDSSVPIAWARELFAAANAPKEFVAVKGTGHLALEGPGAVDAVDGFLSRTLKPVTP